jgi:hypothetical protein
MLQLNPARAQVCSNRLALMPSSVAVHPAFIFPHRTLALRQAAVDQHRSSLARSLLRFVEVELS